MKLLARIGILFLVIILSTGKKNLFSQSISNNIFPEYLESVQSFSPPLIWGCRLCPVPLKPRRRLTWEINLEPIADLNLNLVDSLILDFSRTPGFDLDDLVLSGEIDQVNSTRANIRPGNSTIKKVRQINLDDVDPASYAGRESEINALVQIHKGKRYIPVIADIIIKSKVVDVDILYDDIDLSISQIHRNDDTLAIYNLHYSFRQSIIQPQPLFQTVRDSNDLKCLINLLSPTGDDECRIQQLRLVNDTGIDPPSPCNPNESITQIVRPSLDHSLICIDASTFTPSDVVHSTGSLITAPILVLDGQLDTLYFPTGDIINDSIFYPIDSILSSINGNKIYLYSVPNILACPTTGKFCNGGPEIFVYSRGNRACYSPLFNGLNGTYYLQLKKAYEPKIKFYSVNQPNSSSINWMDSIMADIAYASCLFDEVPSGIDFKYTLNNLDTVSVIKDSLKEVLSAINYYFGERAFYKFPGIVRELRSISNGTYYKDSCLNVYYMDNIPIDGNRNYGPDGGVFVYNNIIVIRPNLASLDVLAHEIGHAMGLNHVGNSGMLDCDGDGHPECTFDDNLMRRSGTGRNKLTVGQIMRMNMKPYSFLRINGFLLSSFFRVCDDLLTSPWYRVDNSCPCIGLNN